MRADGYREAIVGNLSLYSADGERQHTVYIGEAPEHGKGTFLERYTSSQLLDFFHVTEYLTKVSYAAHPGKTDKPKRTVWLDERCRQLKHQPDAAEALINEMETLARETSLTKAVKADLQAALTYFNNHRQMMGYAAHTEKKLPIGSGVTEAACKTLVKQRLCGSGMR